MFTRALVIKTLVGCLLALFYGFVSAQEMQIELLADGPLIIGVVSNADGSPVAETAVQIALVSQPQTSVATLQTDAVGIFTYTGNDNTSYRITVGNTVVDITSGAAPPEPFTWPPIYVTLGILMLLSLIPARILRRKEPQHKE
ncbi:MAG: carboxypeptidase-like regulatory domain-containing protein [Gammaproteobacteria bacterium]|nr:carboxypeptidase-like regulatory domain-containing protein [Gammaproteobacteria bacterium]MDP2141644.1 carboxypeptidase-like regulatory domain-containing protein [Gammaproteobacteria bacterium]MDP2346365.1 carboxypeptidase-like regulatory domain-containing protein [Gammaproteobacteria bacterium]